MKDCKVAILLATYNGERYLRQQLDSLMCQSYCNWVLYVQDDFSTDSTVDIIREYQSRYSNIVLFANDTKLGPKKNFITMLERVEADYYFFCDQDDVWLRDKVERSLQTMCRVEDSAMEKPIVVHTDLMIVNGVLSPIASSFWDYSHIYPEKLTSFAKLGTRRVVTGCTMVMNQTARKVSLPMPDVACMHDVWIALSVVKVGGLLVHINEPTILYRQHSANVVGAVSKHSNWLGQKLLQLHQVWKDNTKTYRMLQELDYGSLLKYLYYKLLTLIEARL